VMVSGGWDTIPSTFAVWDVTTGKKVDRWEYRGGVSSLAISPDGSLLATGVGRKVKLWALPKR
jgi:WD40 repeat protein